VTLHVAEEQQTPPAHATPVHATLHSDPPHVIAPAHAPAPLQVTVVESATLAIVLVQAPRALHATLHWFPPHSIGPLQAPAAHCTWHWLSASQVIAPVHPPIPHAIEQLRPEHAMSWVHAPAPQRMSHPSAAVQSILPLQVLAPH
jgi:hypothetical protein